VKNVPELELPRREKKEPKMAANAAPPAASDFIDVPKEVHEEVDTSHSGTADGSTQVDLSSVSTSQKK